jgi:hypothetical protein
VVGAISTISGWIFGSEKVVWHESIFWDSIGGLGQFFLLVAPIIYVLLDIPDLKKGVLKVVSLLKPRQR